MKKVGIITLSGNNNYGNKLQNIALQEIIKKFGFEVETIWNDDVNHIKIKKRVKDFLIHLKQSINYKMNVFSKISKRRKKFISYNKFIHYSKYNLSNIVNNEKIIDEFNYFVVGSDQVWNYNDPVFSGKYFLDFSKDRSKNISYAASFGIDSIPKRYDSYYKEHIQNFNHVSVRESNALHYLKQLGFNNAVHVLDPTLLLNSKEWDKYVEVPKIEENNDYIIIYFLGIYDKSKIYEYAKKNHYKIIDLLDIKNDYYASNPGNFLYYIKNAKAVFTDSFHCTVFSIIYQKQFLSFEKNQSKKNITNSRINNLLEKLDLLDQKYDEDFYRKIDTNIDYEKVLKKLDLEKKNSITFLKKALNVKDSEM